MRNRLIPGGSILVIGLAFLLCVNGIAVAFATDTAATGSTTAAKNSAFLLRESITWDTTPEQMKQILDDENITYTKQDDYDEYIKQSVTVSNYTGKMGLLYFGDQLMVVGYVFSMDDLTQDDYQYLQNAMCARYGEPTVFEVKRLLKAIYAVTDDVVTTQSDIEHFCGWMLPDGTLIAMLVMDGENASILYLNEPKIYDHKNGNLNVFGL